MKKIIVSLIVGILTAAHIQAQNSDNTRAQWISGELCNSATNTVKRYILIIFPDPLLLILQQTVNIGCGLTAKWWYLKED